MTSTRHGHLSTLVRYPREIAAAVTLRAACAALVAGGDPADGAAGTDGAAGADVVHRPDADPGRVDAVRRPELDRLRAITVTTACGALATRFAMIAFLADPGVPDARQVVPFDPFRDPTPPALSGSGPEPVRARLRTAGDRCASAWRVCRSAGPPDGDAAVGAAGALALGAWCAWAIGSSARAEVRARHALDTHPDDPLAWLVLRAVRVGHEPEWWGTATGRTGSSTVG